MRRPWVDDEALRYIGKLKKLRLINLARTRVTDSGISLLLGLKKMERINLSETRVSSRAVAKLRLALPDLEIVTW
jgi:hypothetical protein